MAMKFSVFGYVLPCSQIDSELHTHRRENLKSHILDGQFTNSLQDIVSYRTWLTSFRAHKNVGYTYFTRQPFEAEARLNNI
jgi:hypothetical protein